LTKKTSLTTLLLLQAFVLLFFAQPDVGHAAKKFWIKFATVAPEGSTWMNHMRRLDQTLRKKSKGEIGFRLYAGGIAGDEMDVLRKIRIGQIHCAAFSGVGLGQVLPMVRVLDLPFLFRDYQEIDLVHKELKPFFAENFKKKNFEFLAWAEVGNVHLFSKKPIRRVKDLSKLKVWTWSGDPISKTTFSFMGTNPIPLAITDVTTALNTGMIDTVYAPSLGALALQWYTYLDYMTSLPLTHSTGAVLLSRKIFNKLPAHLSKMLVDQFEPAMANLTTDLRAQADEAVSLLQKSGLTMIPMPEEKDLKEFFKVHDRVAKDLTGKIYPPELLERVYRLIGRAP
jgi:TRAP-type C4-dicarboxylate transport system substrate-binding protein